MSTVPSILVVDDEPSMLRYIRTVLELESYKVETAASGSEALARIEQGLTPDLMLLDMLMPDLQGHEVLEKVRHIRPHQKVIVLSCVSDTRKVAQAMRLGALDYIAKPFQRAELQEVISHWLEGSENAGDEHAPGVTDLLEVGENVYFYAASPAMRKIRAQAQLVAKVDLPVLLLGESGTGKEVVAQLIHKFSPRSNRAFVKVNCAAVPADLLESELFGYEPGAFTGATRSKPGKFELCNKGTILLDEIGEMPPALQAKLLHVLQDGTFSRLGGRTVMKVDVRIIAATNIDIRRAIAERTFREDLYYRLNGFTLNMPPLRERKDEIPMLLKHFMQRMAERYGRAPLPLTPALVRACCNFEWPGNLRELENFVKRYLVLGDETMMIGELEPKQATTTAAEAATGTEPRSGLKGLVRSLKDDAEMEAIARVLEQTAWNRKKAAAELQISYKALLYKIRQYEIRQRPI